MGIGPLDTLADLQAKFPNATFEQLHPAWAGESDVMYSITGSGLSGKIIVKFNDMRPFYKKMAEEADEKKEDGQNPPVFWREMAGQADNTVMVSWVRWIPVLPIPIERLITKYGKPDRSDFSTDDFEPYKEWTSRGIAAALSDNGKMVVRIEYSFTEKERERAYKARWGDVPSPAPPAGPKSKKKKVSKKGQAVAPPKAGGM
jgi:hypothetical protein